MKLVAAIASFFILIILALRVKLNKELNNSEYGPNYKPNSLVEEDGKYANAGRFFTFWFNNVKPENRNKALFYNSMTVVLIISILILILNAFLKSVY